MLAFIKDVSIVIAGMVALITLVTGVIQYARQGRQLRAAQFIEMRRRFFDDPSFKSILSLLAKDDPSLAALPVQERRNLVGLLEEVAIMVDSQLIRKELAYYMFGYYVRLIANSEHFWVDLDREGAYWRVFNAFAKSLQKDELTFSTKRRARI
ncbi:hypothetical protein QPK87_13610 [Kamptonema cortianum]|nr:hypothetical protein [Geitlerinema splendidum]MDK3157604.1 hypothetical protein [Kamptonema cortianum]